MSIGSQKHHNIEHIQIILQFLIQVGFLIVLKIFFNFKIEGQKEVIEKLKEYRLQEKGIIFAPKSLRPFTSDSVKKTP